MQDTNIHCLMSVAFPYMISRDTMVLFGLQAMGNRNFAIDNFFSFWKQESWIHFVNSHFPAGCCVHHAEMLKSAQFACMLLPYNENAA